jgi:hypothetical protein
VSAGAREQKNSKALDDSAAATFKPPRNCVMTDLSKREFTLTLPSLAGVHYFAKLSHIRLNECKYWQIVSLIHGAIDSLLVEPTDGGAPVVTLFQIIVNLAHDVNASALRTIIDTLGLLPSSNRTRA